MSVKDFVNNKYKKECMKIWFHIFLSFFIKIPIALKFRFYFSALVVPAEEGKMKKKTMSRNTNMLWRIRIIKRKEVIIIQINKGKGVMFPTIYVKTVFTLI